MAVSTPNAEAGVGEWIGREKPGTKGEGNFTAKNAKNTKGQGCRIRRCVGLFKNSFYHAGQNERFFEKKERRWILVGTAVFSQRFIKSKKRVKPTVGYRFGFVLWLNGG